MDIKQDYCMTQGIDHQMENGGCHSSPTDLTQLTEILNKGIQWKLYMLGGIYNENNVWFFSNCIDYKLKQYIINSILHFYEILITFFLDPLYTRHQQNCTVNYARQAVSSVMACLFLQVQTVISCLQHLKQNSWI